MPIAYKDRFDSLIKFLVHDIFPECDWRLIKAQMLQESAANPRAVSPVGAVGLMQLMPATARSLGLEGVQISDIEENLMAGIKYLRIQYTHFPEVNPFHDEKLKFSLASYNGGRGYVNKALELSYEARIGQPMPPGHKGAISGKWQFWNSTKAFLQSPACVVNGRTPDWRQMTDYVDRIWSHYTRLACHACKGAGEINKGRCEGVDNVMEVCPSCDR